MIFGAPIAQAASVLYLFSFFIYEGYQNRFFNKSPPVQADLEKWNSDEKTSSFLNNIFHAKFLKNNKIMFPFLLTLFFFYKCLTSFMHVSGYTLKIFMLGVSLLCLNFVLFLGFGLWWHNTVFPGFWTWLFSTSPARDVGLKSSSQQFFSIVPVLNEQK